MVVKLITVYVKQGHWPAYQVSQAIWNRETSKAEGYLGGFCGKAIPGKTDDHTARLIFFWRSKEDLDRWMRQDHDRIAALAGADEHYERIETHALEPFTEQNEAVTDIIAQIPGEPAAVQFWSEAYRGTAALRTALRLDLFEHMAKSPAKLESMATALRTEATLLRHLMRALKAMGLVDWTPEGWKNSDRTSQTLLKASPAFQGDIILHNSRPESVARMLSFGENLGLPQEDETETEMFDRFIRAMGNTASAGQAKALVDAVDLSDDLTLLDIGGATGPYSIALCEAYPRLKATVLDQAATESAAQSAIREARLTDRIEFKIHDYTSGPFPGPVDVALLSNVLRGETPEMVFDILSRLRDALRPSGRVIIHDHFADDDDGQYTAPHPSGLRAALFGMHLVDKSNYSVAEMKAAIRETGYHVLRYMPLVGTVVMNGAIEAKPVEK